MVHPITNTLIFRDRPIFHLIFRDRNRSRKFNCPQFRTGSWRKNRYSLFIVAYDWLSCSVNIIFITSIGARRTNPAYIDIYWQKSSSTKKLLEKAKFRRASPISFSSPMDSSLLIVQLSVSIGVSVLRWCNPPMTRISFSILSATTPLRLSPVSLLDQGLLGRHLWPQ